MRCREGRANTEGFSSSGCGRAGGQWGQVTGWAFCGQGQPENGPPLLSHGGEDSGNCLSYPVQGLGRESVSPPQLCPLGTPCRMHVWPCFGPQSLAEPPLLSCLSQGRVGIPSPAGSQESLASCHVVLGCGSEIGTHLPSQHQEPWRPQWCLPPSCTSAECATSAGLPPSVGPRTGLRLCLLSSVSQHTGQPASSSAAWITVSHS